MSAPAAQRQIGRGRRSACASGSPLARDGREGPLRTVAVLLARGRRLSLANGGIGRGLDPLQDHRSGSRARRRNVRAMTQQAPHQHSYTIPLEWESRVPIVTTVRTIEMTRSHSTDKPSSWVTSATRVTVVGCECGATYRRDLPL